MGAEVVTPMVLIIMEDFLEVEVADMVPITEAAMDTRLCLPEPQYCPEGADGVIIDNFVTNESDGDCL